MKQVLEVLISQCLKNKNRILTDHISKLLLAPTKDAEKNLEKEGIKNGVHNIGDVMYDAVLMFKENLR